MRRFISEPKVITNIDNDNDVDLIAGVIGAIFVIMGSFVILVIVLVFMKMK